MLTVFIVLWRLVSPIKIVPALLMAIPTLMIFIYLYRHDIGGAYKKGIKLLKHKELAKE